jgi:hypothetical protein
MVVQQGERPETTGSAAAQQGSEIGAKAREQAGEVASTAREQAGNVASTAVDEGRQVVSQARDALHEQARSRTDELSKSVRRFGDGMQALAEGRPEEAGQVGDYARQAAGRVNELAQRLETRGYDGVADDVANFARRRPGVFLAAAGVLGFAVGRMVRSGALSSSSSSGSGNGSGNQQSGDGFAYSPPLAAAPSTVGAIGVPVVDDPTLAGTGVIADPGAMR